MPRTPNLGIGSAGAGRLRSQARSPFDRSFIPLKELGALLRDVIWADLVELPIHCAYRVGFFVADQTRRARYRWNRFTTRG